MPSIKLEMSKALTGAIGNWKLEIPRLGRAGFTLVELLVAIAIVAMVFGVVIGSTAQIQKSGRDARRESDLRNLQSALQQYFADQNYYPTSPTGDISALASLHNCIGSDPSNSSCSITKTYLKPLPADPDSNKKYCYVPLSSATVSPDNVTDCDNSPTDRCYFYKLFTYLESSNNPAITQSYCGSTNYNFQLAPN